MVIKVCFTNVENDTDKVKLKEILKEVMDGFSLHNFRDVIKLNNDFFDTTKALKIPRQDSLWRMQKVQLRKIVLYNKLLYLREKKHVWRKNFCNHIWERGVLNDQAFKETFKVSPEVFEILCIQLKRLEKENSDFRKSMPYRKRIAIALYALGSVENYKSIGRRFGIITPRVRNIIRKFCAVVWNALRSKYWNRYTIKQERVEASLKDCECAALKKEFKYLFDEAKFEIETPSEEVKIKVESSFEEKIHEYDSSSEETDEFDPSKLAKIQYIFPSGIIKLEHDYLTPKDEANTGDPPPEEAEKELAYSSDEVKIQPESSCKAVGPQAGTSAATANVEAKSKDADLSPGFASKSGKFECNSSSKEVKIQSEYVADEAKLQVDPTCKEVKLEHDFPSAEVELKNPSQESELQPEFSSEETKRKCESNCENFQFESRSTEVKLEPGCSYKQVELENASEETVLQSEKKLASEVIRESKSLYEEANLNIETPYFEERKHTSTFEVSSEQSLLEIQHPSKRVKLQLESRSDGAKLESEPSFKRAKFDTETSSKDGQSQNIFTTEKEKQKSESFPKETKPKAESESFFKKANLEFEAVVEEEKNISDCSSEQSKLESEPHTKKANLSSESPSNEPKLESEQSVFEGTRHTFEVSSELSNSECLSKKENLKWENSRANEANLESESSSKDTELGYELPSNETKRQSEPLAGASQREYKFPFKECAPVKAEFEFGSASEKQFVFSHEEAKIETKCSFDETMPESESPLEGAKCEIQSHTEGAKPKLETLSDEIRHSYTLLTARFRRVEAVLDNPTDNIPLLAKACCVLHNFLSKHNESIQSNWLEKERSNTGENSDSKVNDLSEYLAFLEAANITDAAVTPHKVGERSGLGCSSKKLKFRSRGKNLNWN